MARRADDGAAAVELSPARAPAATCAARCRRSSATRSSARSRASARTLPGFAGAEAQLVGVETRTSSPVRIVRDDARCASPTHPGLYPAGEGAGYAGGIVSAAVDGMRVADAILAAL